MLDRLQVTDFEDLIGDRVRIRSEDAEALTLTLAEAQGLRTGETERRRPFSLLFHGPSEPVLPQGTYRVEHESMEALDLFLVPIGPDPEAQADMVYEAVFG